VKNIVLFLKKLLLFEIPYSIFDIQNEKHAKAIRLKGEGFKPGEWKNKLFQRPSLADTPDKDMPLAWYCQSYDPRL